MSTGQEIKAQVMEALDYLYHRTPLSGEKLDAHGRSEVWDDGRAALAPCLVLTEEEAAKVRSTLDADLADFFEVLALLTPADTEKEEAS